jgi:hypothetical protein
MELYSKLQRLGEAKFGEAYKAVYSPTGVEVIIKRIPMKRLVEAIPEKLLGKIQALGRSNASWSEEAKEPRAYHYFPVHVPLPLTLSALEDAAPAKPPAGEACLAVAFPALTYQLGQVMRSLDTPLLVWTPMSLEEFAHSLTLFSADFTKIVQFQGNVHYNLQPLAGVAGGAVGGDVPAAPTTLRHSLPTSPRDGRESPPRASQRHSQPTTPRAHSIGLGIRSLSRALGGSGGGGIEPLETDQDYEVLPPSMMAGASAGAGVGAAAAAAAAAESASASAGGTAAASRIAGARPAPLAWLSPTSSRPGTIQRLAVGKASPASAAAAAAAPRTDQGEDAEEPGAPTKKSPAAVPKRVPSYMQPTSSRKSALDAVAEEKLVKQGVRPARKAPPAPLASGTPKAAAAAAAAPSGGKRPRAETAAAAVAVAAAPPAVAAADARSAHSERDRSSTGRTPTSGRRSSGDEGDGDAERGGRGRSRKRMTAAELKQARSASTGPAGAGQRRRYNSSSLSKAGIGSGIEFFQQELERINRALVDLAEEERQREQTLKLQRNLEGLERSHAVHAERRRGLEERRAQIVLQIQAALERKGGDEAERTRRGSGGSARDLGPGGEKAAAGGWHGEAREDGQPEYESEEQRLHALDRVKQQLFANLNNPLNLGLVRPGEEGGGEAETAEAEEESAEQQQARQHRSLEEEMRQAAGRRKSKMEAEKQNAALIRQQSLQRVESAQSLREKKLHEMERQVAEKNKEVEEKASRIRQQKEQELKEQREAQEKLLAERMRKAAEKKKQAEDARNKELAQRQKEKNKALEDAKLKRQQEEERQRLEKLAQVQQKEREIARINAEKQRQADEAARRKIPPPPKNV